VRYLLDTNAVIALVKRETRFLKRARQQSPSDFGIPSIAAHELYFGAYKSGRVEENLARIEYLRLIVVEFDSEDAREAGQLRRSSLRQEHRLGRTMCLLPVKQRLET
jgi:tRNA(fMet)-specific endonuclease VapC